MDSSNYYAQHYGTARFQVFSLDFKLNRFYFQVIIFLSMFILTSVVSKEMTSVSEHYVMDGFIIGSMAALLFYPFVESSYLIVSQHREFIYYFNFWHKPKLRKIFKADIDDIYVEITPDEKACRMAFIFKDKTLWHPVETVTPIINQESLEASASKMLELLRAQPSEQEAENSTDLNERVCIRHLPLLRLLLVVAFVLIMVARLF